MKALLLVDVQIGLTKRNLYNKEIFLSTAKQAINKFRDGKDKVIFVQHENEHLINGTVDWEVDHNLPVEPNDKVFSKQVGDAFSNKELVKYLNDFSIKEVFICGLVTHGCIKHTCLGGIKQGYNTALIKNAHSNWAADAQKNIAVTEELLSEAGVKLLDIETL